MLNRLAKLREELEAREDKGFTLIELLVVVVIIGILIAIAIPLYLNYQKGSHDKSADSDLRGAVSVLEQCNSDNGSFPAKADVKIGPLGTSCSGQTITASDGTTVSYDVSTGGDSYVMWAWNRKGNKELYCYDSSKGGSVKGYGTGDALPAAGTACAAQG